MRSLNTTCRRQSCAVSEARVQSCLPLPFPPERLSCNLKKGWSDASKRRSDPRPHRASACPDEHLVSRLAILEAAKPQKLERATIAVNEAQSRMPEPGKKAQDRDPRDIL